MRKTDFPCDWGRYSRKPCRRTPSWRVLDQQAYGGDAHNYCRDHIVHSAVLEAVIEKDRRAIEKEFTSDLSVPPVLSGPRVS